MPDNKFNTQDPEYTLGYDEKENDTFKDIGENTLESTPVPGHESPVEDSATMFQPVSPYDSRYSPDDAQTAASQQRIDTLRQQLQADGNVPTETVHQQPLAPSRGFAFEEPEEEHTMIRNIKDLFGEEGAKNLLADREISRNLPQRLQELMASYPTQVIQAVFPRPSMMEQMKQNIRVPDEYHELKSVLDFVQNLHEHIGSGKREFNYNGQTYSINGIRYVDGSQLAVSAYSPGMNKVYLPFAVIDQFTGTFRTLADIDSFELT